MRIEKLRTEHNVKIEWVHFPLHPETPAEGRSLEDLFRGRNVDRKAMHAQMKARMDAEGLPYGERTMTYNSRLSQELGKWADTQPGGEAFHDAMFRAYFVDARNISEPAVLLEIVAEVGLPVAPPPARCWRSARSRRRWTGTGRSRASTASPACRPSSRASRGVVGAQPYEVLEQLVKQARAEEAGEDR